MAVLIFADSSNGKIAKAGLEAINYGKKIAQNSGTDCVAVTYGDLSQKELSKLGNYGASKVLVARSPLLTNADPQLLTKIISAAAEKCGANIIITSHDNTGKAVAPRIAARLKAGLVPGAVALPESDGSFVVKKAVFSGKAFANYEIKSDKKVISLLPNSHSIEIAEGQASVEDLAVELSESDTGIKVKEIKKLEGGSILLPEAEIVVSGGRGLKGPENWQMIEDFAKELGAATACSRPVADMGWRPHHEHVGQTGVAIRPNLYFAIGISGAIQHLAGVNGSKVMVVINKDPEAPFFKAADYGIVGDAFEVVPKLIEGYRKFKEANN